MGLEYIDTLALRDFAVAYLPDELRAIYVRKNAESKHGVSPIANAITEWGHNYPFAGAIGLAAIHTIELAEGQPIIHFYIHGRFPWTIRPNPEEGESRVVKCQKTLDKADEAWQKNDAPTLRQAILTLARLAEVDPPKWLSAKRESESRAQAGENQPASEQAGTARTAAQPPTDDDEEVNVFIPKLHPEIAALIEAGIFRASMYDMATQAYDPHHWRTQEWADRIKAALARGVFEIATGAQAMPDALIALPGDSEVVLRYPSCDGLVTAQSARQTIQEIIERQAAGKFHFNEVVAILVRESGENEKTIYQAMWKAFDSGHLRFFTPAGSPIEPTGRDMPLGYGEYTTTDEVNHWLEGWGARYRLQADLITKEDEDKATSPSAPLCPNDRSPSKSADNADIQLTAENGPRWLQATHWTERELEALCFGIDPKRYGDRDEIADTKQREHVRQEIGEGLRTGRLHGKLKEGAGPADSMYRCKWEIEPHNAILWAEERFPRFPQFLVKEEIRKLYREQDAAKQSAGRFTLEEAAIAIAGGTEDVQGLCAKLMRAAIAGDLPVYFPGKLTKHDYSKDKTVREYYEEAYWEDLNRWLNENEPRLPFRFSAPPPVQQTLATSAETPEQRCARLANRRNELKQKRIKAWQKQLATEEGIGVSRVKQLLKQHDDASSHRPTAHNPFPANKASR